MNNSSNVEDAVDRGCSEETRAAIIEACARVAESAITAGENVRDKMAPESPFSGLEDALHAIVVTTARGIAANIRALARNT